MRSPFNFNHFEVFAVLSETLSFSQAAKTLGIAQPVVSKQIKLLEEAMQNQLFTRNNKKVQLTPFGKVLAKKTLPLYREILERFHDIQHESGLMKGQITMGALAEFGQSVLVTQLAKFKALYPQIQLHIEFLKSSESIQRLEENQIDLCVVAPPLPLKTDLLAKVLYEEEVVLVSKNARVRDLRLDELPFVAYRQDDPLLYAYLKKFYPKINYDQIKLEATVNSHRSVAELVSELGYFAVCPRVSVERELKEKKIFQVGDQVLKSKLYLLSKKVEIKDKKVEALKSFLQKALK